MNDNNIVPLNRTQTKKITILKLTNGEEIVGEDVSAPFENAQGVKLKNPLRIYLNPMQTATGATQLVLQMMPYMPYAKETEYFFAERDILNVATPTDDLATQYISKFSSLALPKKPTFEL